MKSIRTLTVALLGMAVAACASAAQTLKSAGYALGEAAHDALTGFMAGAGFMLFATTRTPVHTGVLPIRNQPTDQGIYEMPVPFDFPAANPTVNDILALCKIPVGVQVIDWTVIPEDADSNGAPTLAGTLGSLNAALDDISVAWKTGVLFGTGAITRADGPAAFSESTAAERSIGIKWTAAAATYAAGKKGIVVLRLRA